MKFLIKSEPVGNIQNLIISNYFKLCKESAEYEITENIENTIKIMSVLNTLAYTVELYKTIDKDLNACFDVCLYKKGRYGNVMLVFHTMTWNPFEGLAYCLDYIANQGNSSEYSIIKDFILKNGKQV